MSTVSNPSCTAEELMAALQKLGEDPTAERVTALQSLVPELKPRDGWAHEALIVDAVRVARMRLWASTMPYPRLVDVIGTNTKNEPISTDGLLFEGDRLFLGAGFKDVKHQPIRAEDVTSIDLVSIPLSAGDHLGIDKYEVIKGDALTIDDFAHSQRRIEDLDMSFAMGQELPFDESLREQLDNALDAAPWMIDMDSGKIVPKNWEVEPVQVSPYRPLADEQQFDRLMYVQEWGPELTLRLMRSFLRSNDLFGKMRAFAEDVAANANVAGIRDGDAALERKVAKAFGYDSAAAMAADEAQINKEPSRNSLLSALSEIVQSLDGLGEPATRASIEDNYVTRARYIAEVAVGKREPFPEEPVLPPTSSFFTVAADLSVSEKSDMHAMSRIYSALAAYGINDVSDLEGYDILRAHHSLSFEALPPGQGFVMGPLSAVVVKHGASVEGTDGSGREFVLEPANGTYVARPDEKHAQQDPTGPEM